MNKTMAWSNRTCYYWEIFGQISKISNYAISQDS